MYSLSQAVRLVSELCLHYKLHDPNLWSKLLRQLLHLNMVSEVRIVVGAHLYLFLASTQGGICEVFAQDSLWNVTFMDSKFI